MEWARGHGEDLVEERQGGIAYNQAVTVDPYSLLPTWLHPR